MDHVVMISGGVASWAAAKRCVDWYGKDSTQLLFTDTLFEDQDTYRFLIESSANVFQIPRDRVDDLKNRALKLSEDMDVRGEELDSLKKDVMKAIPNLNWISDGRSIWKVFEDGKFLGNSRVDLCSRILKRETADKWISKHYKPTEVTCYTGIDFTEIHRHERLSERKLPYVYKAILCEEPPLTKPEMHRWADSEGIEKQRLYKMEMPHANCGGGCVKAGQKHWKYLHSQWPERYQLWENYEQELYKKSPNVKPFLKKTENKETFYLSLKEFREKYIEGTGSIDEYDWGGCGCYIDSNDDLSNEVSKESKGAKRFFFSEL